MFKKEIMHELLSLRVTYHKTQDDFTEFFKLFKSFKHPGWKKNINLQNSQVIDLTDALFY